MTTVTHLSACLLKGLKASFNVTTVTHLSACLLKGLKASFNVTTVAPGRAVDSPQRLPVAAGSEAEGVVDHAQPVSVRDQVAVVRRQVARLVRRHQQRELPVGLAHALQSLLQRAHPVVAVADVLVQLLLQVDVTGAQLQVCVTVTYLPEDTVENTPLRLFVWVVVLLLLYRRFLSQLTISLYRVMSCQEGDNSIPFRNSYDDEFGVQKEIERRRKDLDDN